jgi:hypothetical protein
MIILLESARVEHRIYKRFLDSLLKGVRLFNERVIGFLVIPEEINLCNSQLRLTHDRVCPDKEQVKTGKNKAFA